MKRIWPFIIFLCCNCPVFSNPVVDSLQSQLKPNLPDSTRLHLLNELAYQTLPSNVYISLSYADEGLLIAEKLKDRKQKRQLLHLKALSHHKLGHYDKTLVYFREVLKMFEEDKDQWGVCRMLNNLGILYFDLEQLEKSLSLYKRALQIKEQLQDTASIPNTLCNIGLVHLRQNKPDSAYALFQQALAIDRELNNTLGIAYTYEYLGQTFEKMQEHDSALHYYSRSLKLLKKDKHNLERCVIFNSSAKVYLEIKDPEKAIHLLELAVSEGKKANARIKIKESYHLLAQAYSQLNDFKNAYLFHQKFTTLKDSIFNEENLQKIREVESGYQIQKREKEIEILKKDAQISSLNLFRTEIVSYFLYGGLLLLFTFILFLNKQYKTKNKSHKLLKKWNNEISERNNHITSSINYAKTIQEAILPQENRLLHHFPDSFVLSKARDIVSGDFFWFYPSDNFYLLAVIDCTGHGVPGAFMTVMANSLLNQIIIDNQTYFPAEILAQLQQRLKKSIHNDKGFQISKDGLDLVICRIEKENKKITFASAKRPVYLIQHNEFSIFKGNKTTLGGPLSQLTEEFHEYEVPFCHDSSLYLFTDGLTDQFGEKTNKKFMPHRFRDLLLDIHLLPMQEQKRKLEATISQWRGHTEQTDDMLLLGIRL